MQPMTLRAQIEELIANINEDPLLQGAPIDTAVEMLQKVLNDSADKEQPTDKPAAVPALLTPCHGEPLDISLRSESTFGGYGTVEVIDDITCPASGCLNTWDRDGTFLYGSPE